MPAVFRVTGFVIFLLFIVLGYLLVGIYRDDDSVSDIVLVMYGWIPIIIGFVIAWVCLEIASRLDSRACPQCGRRVPAGDYVCSSCGFDFRPGQPPARTA